MVRALHWFQNKVINPICSNPSSRSFALRSQARRGRFSNAMLAFPCYALREFSSVRLQAPCPNFHTWIGLPTLISSYKMPYQNLHYGALKPNLQAHIPTTWAKPPKSLNLQSDSLIYQVFWSEGNRINITLPTVCSCMSALKAVTHPVPRGALALSGYAEDSPRFSTVLYDFH